MADEHKSIYDKPQLKNLFTYNKEGEIIEMNYYPTLGDLYDFQRMLQGKDDIISKHNNEKIRKLINCVVCKPIHTDYSLEYIGIIENKDG